MSASAKIQLPMSVSAFLEWDPGDGLQYQLVDGEARAMAPGSTLHGFLQNELGRLLGNHLSMHRPGCRVVANPGVVPGMLPNNVRIPDLGVTCAKLQPGQPMLPEPLLLVEILSPGNTAKTWSNVWTYVSIVGLAEILILHSTRVFAQLLRRGGDGTWPEQPADVHDNLMLASVGFEVSLADLYADTGLTA